jgi:DNA-binding SARP family transcriptional activator
MSEVSEFGLLGPLLVRSGGAEVPIRRGHQRALLALLLLRANHSVPIDEITEVLWGAAPPVSAPVAIRSYIRCLRLALGETGRQRISTQPRGYLIRVADDELDVARFERLLVAARAAVRGGSWREAAGRAREALSWWRGEPLADIESETIALRDVPRLAELRLQAVEIRIDADLRLGGHAEAIAELPRLRATHPLREQFHALLMRALYQCGRQAEALEAYQRARDVLVTELGVEPGPGLQELHQRILTADPALSPLVAPPAGATIAQAAVPRELPARVRHFTGRDDELAALTRMLDRSGAQDTEAIVISAIGGTAGVGKTALAVHWAHQVAGRFGDGQLYVNLRGFDPSGVPVTPAEAVRGFLDTLGVPPDRIPHTPDAQARLYRSLLADKRMLVVLDNARDEAQVRPLLPASPASVVIITSRNQLTGLAAADGARLLTLDVLPHNEAVLLLTARLGSARAAAEPAATEEISQLCACLPLALAVAAAWAAARPRFPLGELAAELRGAAGRLDALDAGDPAASVAAVFSWSYRQLGPGAARLFRLLGLHPGPDISVPAAASLAGIDQPQARRLLRELARDCLITEHAPGRYAFHDLLRAYAASQARDHDSQPDRDAAIGRTLDHYLHTAARATLVLRTGKAALDLAPVSHGTIPEQLADHRQALEWFTAEHQVLLAAVTLAAGTGADRHAWQLPYAMAEYLYRRGHVQEWTALLSGALAAATRLGDVPGQAMSLRALANAYANAGDHDQARAHLERCLPLYQRLGDRPGQAWTQRGLSIAAAEQGRHADALAHGEQALRLFRDAGHEGAEAGLLNNLAWCHALTGDYQRARGFCEQSLALIARLGGTDFEYNVWDTLGYVELHLGDFIRATEHFEHALPLCRDHGDRSTEAEILTHIGDARHAAGDLPQARKAWRQALAIYDDTHHPDADKVRVRLAGADG